MPKFPHSAGVEFLHTELQNGLTFAHVALSARPDQTDKTQRNTLNARRAYDSYLKFRQRAPLNASDEKALASKAELLKSALRSLGEAV